MGCVSRLFCPELPAGCLMGEPRRSQLSPLFETRVPHAFCNQEFDVPGVTGAFSQSQVGGAPRAGFARPMTYNPKWGFWQAASRSK